MNVKSIVPWIGPWLLVAVFAGVFFQAMEWRAGKGVIYPPYSTNRHDPLGGSGLLSAFERLPGISCQQNYTSLNSIEGLGPNDALFLLGLPSGKFPDIHVPDQSPVLQAVRDRGTRLVITLHPDPFLDSLDPTGAAENDDKEQLKKRRRPREERKNNNQSGPEAEPNPDLQKPRQGKDAKGTGPSELGPSLGERFNLLLKTAKAKKTPPRDGKAEPGDNIEGQPMPPLPPWRSALRFEPQGIDAKAWKIAATVDNMPVIVERKFGSGSIVMTTDSYFASNEALRQGSDGSILLWLAGGKRRILFDETLHGSEQKLGVVKILRQHRLHGVLIGALFFLVLWAWRCSSSLTPGNEDLERGLIGEGKISGEGSPSGFVHLLQRHIADHDLLANCVRAWREAQQEPLSTDKENRLVETLSRHQNNPKDLGVVSAYLEIAKILKKR